MTIHASKEEVVLSNITIDGLLLKKMIIEGTNALEKSKSLVDSLNVFPVPDGDTGTNMSLTILAAAKEVDKLKSKKVGEIAKAAASGSLRGARGNSGVIVSQLFRGFAKSLEGKEIANLEDIADAFLKASETAYKAVMKPKEGTILTVARVIAEKANDMVLSTEDFDEFADGVMKTGQEILQKTTQMLPQLKEAGVVDAGGKGLLIFLEGAISGAHLEGGARLREASDEDKVISADFSQLSTEDIKFAYCTEFFINLEKADSLEAAEGKLKDYLEKIGDSIVVVGDEDIIKVHIHSNHPGKVLEKSMTFGYLSNMKIENMKLQHTSLIEATTEGGFSVDTASPKEVGIVAVAMGDGMANLFRELGADVVIEGGQTMNPSTNDFLDAIGKINAESIILLPNNKNVILAAAQAAELCGDKRVYTIPSKTMPQGLAAMINYVSVVPVGEMTENMKNAVKEVKTGQVTFAVRDTSLNGKTIKEGDILCMIEDDIDIVTNEIESGAFELLNKMITEDSQIVTIYYGADSSEENAQKLKDKLDAENYDIEVDVQNGGQQLYFYIFSVE